MKPKRARPNRMLAQKRAAGQEIRKFGKVRLVPTFPRPTTAYDYAVRRLQKSRVSSLAVLLMLESKDPVLRKSALERIEADPKIVRILGKQSMPELKELTRHDNRAVRITATRIITQIYMKEENIQELKKLIDYCDMDMLSTVANGLTRIYAKKRNIQELKSLMNHNLGDVRRAAANELELIYVKKKPPELKNPAKHPLRATGRIAAKWLNKLKGRKRSFKTRLLSARKPFAATAFLPEILRRARSFDYISQELKRKFGNQFTGIVIFGSMAKGYATPKSDVDYAVIASNRLAASEFRKMVKARGLPLCREHYINPNEKGNDSIAPLFYGLFFGDRGQLRREQRNVLARFGKNPKAWDRLREEILGRETNLEKAFERAGITSRAEQQRLMAAAALRVPPPLAEMKRILGIK